MPDNLLTMVLVPVLVLVLVLVLMLVLLLLLLLLLLLPLLLLLLLLWLVVLVLELMFVLVLGLVLVLVLTCLRGGTLRRRGRRVEAERRWSGLPRLSEILPRACCKLCCRRRCRCGWQHCFFRGRHRCWCIESNCCTDAAIVGVMIAATD